MTEPLDAISRIRGAGKKSQRGDDLKHEKSKKRHEESEDDSVDISEEARDRASGKKRGNILEYIRNQGD